MINSVCGIRSTGRIVTDIADKYIAAGHECRIAYGREEPPYKYKSISYRIGSAFGVYLNAFKSRFCDNEGFNAKRATKKFIEWANDYNPDVLWLHNIHGYYINIELLFKWIKSRPHMQVKWTLHDCWAFTGHCVHFSYVKCDKWKNGCNKCMQTSVYPTSLYKDNSNNNYVKKMNAFCGVHNMTLITPSNWLADLVKKSFLKNYNVNVEYNTIDKNTFKPTKSNFRETYSLLDKKIVLGVASSWSERKGLGDFVELSKLLDENYKIVLVGLDRKQAKKIPSGILCLPCTNSVTELAEAYSSADVFVNPSREETFGLTTLEAISCGTPAIVYKDTACEEIANIYGGIVVEQSVQAIKKVIERM